MVTVMLFLLFVLLVAAVVLFTVSAFWRSLARLDSRMLRARAEIGWRKLFPAPSLGWDRLQRRIHKRMLRCVTVSAGGVHVTPTQFVVGLVPSDLAKMEGVRSFVEIDLGNCFAAEARKQGWSCAEPPTVMLTADVAALPGVPRIEATFGADSYLAATGGRTPSRPANAPLPASRTERLPRSLTAVERLPRSLTAVERLPASQTEPWAMIELTSMDPAHSDIDLSGRIGTLLLGRGADCDLVMDAPTVSEQHALLRRTGAGLEVEDLGSRNGTFRNGQRIAGTTRITHGDYISFSQNGPRFRYSQLDRSLPTRVRRRGR